jgi:hypothetical protein
MAFSRSALAIATVLMTAVAAACAATTADMLPPASPLDGWHMREGARAYTPANLYEYIDGNADLFLSYGFADLSVGDYTPVKGEGWISVDVYNMGTPLQAFGIFGAEKPVDVEPAAVGAQGYASEGLIAFWKGPYYVKVSLVEGEDKDAAKRLAEVAADRISAEPTMPAELARLPAEKRVPGSERYVKSGALGHKFLVEVVSADYKLDGSTGALYIADLGTPEKAAARMAKLREFEASTHAEVASITGVGDDGFAVRDPYYGEMVVARTDRFMAIGVSEKAKRKAVRELVTAGLASARAATVNARLTGPAAH